METLYHYRFNQVTYSSTALEIVSDYIDAVRKSVFGTSDPSIFTKQNDMFDALLEVVTDSHTDSHCLTLILDFLLEQIETGEMDLTDILLQPGRILMAGMQRKDCPVPILVRASTNPLAPVRWAAANNPSCPEENQVIVALMRSTR